MKYRITLWTGGAVWAIYEHSDKSIARRYAAEDVRYMRANGLRRIFVQKDSVVY